MAWPESIAESFPEPHDDEPASLRQDIADELADHLQTSLARQIVGTLDEATARERVVERFGDARGLARSLWFDAMREKIMRQRIIQIAAGLSLVLCVVLGFLLWRTLERSQAAMAELVNTNRAAAKEYHDSNEALRNQLEKMQTAAAAASAPAPVRSQDWNPVRVRVTMGTKDGPPVEGLEIRFAQVKPGMNGMIAMQNFAIKEFTDAHGFADLDRVHPGRYLLTVVNRKHPRQEILERPIAISPGSDNTLEIVCPAGNLCDAKVSIKTNLPDDLRDQGVCVVLYFMQSPRMAADCPWVEMKYMSPGNLSDPISVRNPVLNIFESPDRRLGKDVCQFAGNKNNNSERYFQIGITNENDDAWSVLSEDRPFEVANVEHFLFLIALIKKTDIDDEALNAGLNVGAEVGSRNRSIRFKELSRRYLLPLGRFQTQISGGDKALLADLQKLPTFVTLADQTTEWKVEIPAELIDEVREKLQASKQE